MTNNSQILANTNIELIISDEGVWGFFFFGKALVYKKKKKKISFLRENKKVREFLDNFLRF